MTSKNAVTMSQRDCRRLIFFDFHTGEYPGYTCFSRWDPAQIVDQAARAGADMMCFFSKDHFGNCFCDLPNGHRHKDVTGDFTGQAVAEMRRRGLGAAVYYSVYADRFEGLRHPEWQVQNPQYQEWRDGGFPWLTLCHNAAFTDEIVIPHLTTVTQRYRPDALFLDTMNYAGVCSCEGCRKAYRELLGRELDVEHLRAHPREWATFFHKTWNRSMKRIVDACHAIMPEVEFIFGARRDNPDLARESEALTTMDGMESCLQYLYSDLGSLTPGLEARSLRTKPIPTRISINAFNGSWGEATVKNAVLLTAECAGARANGVRFNMAEYVRSWGLAEPAAMQAMGEALKAEQPFEALSLNIPAPRHIAVLDNNTLPTNQFVCGMGKLLVEAHEQFDIIDETVLDNLSGYRLLWAPPIQLWKPERWTRVLQWVSDGGVLLLEASGECLRDPGLAKVIEAAGVDGVKASPYGAAYFMPQGAHLDERHGAMPILLHEPTWNYDAGRAARVVDVSDPIAESDPLNGIVFRTNVLHPDIDKRRAGIVESAVGKGSILLLPGSLSRGYFQHNYSPLRRLVMRLIRGKVAPLFEVEAPPYVEANLLADNTRLVVHLVQYCLNHSGGNDAHHNKTNPKGLWCGERYHDIEDIRPLFDVPVRIRCARKPEAVIEHPARQPLKWSYTGGICNTILPRLDLHGAVEVRM